MCVDGISVRKCPKCGVATSGSCPICEPGNFSPTPGSRHNVAKTVATRVKCEFVVASHVKKIIKAEGRRAGADFLQALDEFVRRKVKAACAVHNGGKVTLDAACAGAVGLISDRGGKKR